MLEFGILGRRLRVFGSCDVSLEALLRSRWDFPEYDQGFSGQGSSEVTLAVELVSGCPADFSADFLSIQSAGLLKLRSGDVSFCEVQSIVWLGGTKTGLRLEFVNSHTKAVVWGDVSSDPELVHMAIAEGLRCSGLVSLHASIAARDGRAFAFLGPSGRGKTTTLLRALEAGFVPVCEDFAWCDPGTLDVFGFDRGLRLLPDTAEVFEQQFGIRPTVWQVDKWFVPYSSLNLEPRAVKLSTIVLLERDPARATGFGSLSKRGAALALWESSGMPLSKQVQDRLSGHVAAMVARLGLRVLRLGQGPIVFDQI